MTDRKKKPGNSRHPMSELVHRGRHPFEFEGFVNPAVYRGSTVLFPTFEALKARTQPYTYGRRGTPTTRALEEAICHLEGGALTILTASGFQAVTTALLAFVEQGDHVLVPDSVYQPTRAFCDRTLSRLGITTTYYDPLVGRDIGKLITPSTRVLFTESPGSQTFEMQDIPAICEEAHKHDIWVLMDNTWATPLYFKAIEYGVDVSIQAATKYVVGHADALLGTATGNERASGHLNRIKENLGVCAGSEETFLALRGLRTMGVRLEHHFKAGIKVAQWLSEHECVAKVIHPALSSHPGYAIWKRDFCGASGLFAITLKPVSETALAAMLDEMEFFSMGYSWGGYESLILPFDPRPFRTATTWDEAGPALRLHVGLEDVDDLIGDLAAGFERLKRASA